jgi:hypothetical protein
VLLKSNTMDLVQAVVFDKTGVRFLHDAGIGVVV